ncbi:MAG: aminotransferase class III-fold pyridoxal phosphate-dependent enzyme [Pseudomonadota bacterium]
MKIDNCLKMQERAKNRIPGMTQLLSKRPDMFAPGVWPAYYSRAEGVEVWDLDDNHYIDMSIAGIGANVLGYADPDVNKAVVDVVTNGSSCTLNSAKEVELAELLCKLHPWAQMARFTRSGGESMAVAIRIARAHSGRDKIAFCGYHGWHDWYMAANLQSEDALGDHLLTGLDPVGVPSGLAGTMLPFRYNKIEDLKKNVSRHGRDIGVIVMEPIRSQQPENNFLQEVKEIAESINAVLVIDEISAGFRMNTGGAHMILDFEPDIAVFSKALGNGFPIGAIIGKREIMDTAQKTFISSTSWTEQVGPAAAIACIKKHNQCNVGDHLMDIGKSIQAGWRKMSEKHDLRIKVSGIPPLSHFVFDYPNALEMKTLFVQEMLKRHFLASNLFYAMYAHTKEHVKDYLCSVDAVFEYIEIMNRKDQVKSCLKGPVASSGFRRLA